MDLIIVEPTQNRGDPHSLPLPVHYSCILSFCCLLSFQLQHSQWRPSSQCHCAIALVVFLPRPEIWGIFWVPGIKKSQSPKVALVDFRPDGRPWPFQSKIVKVNIDQHASKIMQLYGRRKKFFERCLMESRNMASF